MPNCFELVVHYLACFKAGLVATPLNYRYTAPEIDHALGVSEARALLAHVERDEDLAACEGLAQLPLGRIGYGGVTHLRITLRGGLHPPLPPPTLETPAPPAPPPPPLPAPRTRPPL